MRIRLLLYLGLLLALITVFPLLVYGWISFSARPYQFSQLETVPRRKVALVLGTSKYVAGGRENIYYRNRINAAIALYRAGKVKYFIVSGDNRSPQYNEPQQMKIDLMAGGVPPDHIQQDFAGLRTLDSVLRAEAIFGQRDYIIVSQPFHNARAVFLARHHGQAVIAFNAANPMSFKYRLKTQVREIGARLRAVWDLLSGNEARHYGEPITFPPEN